MGFPDFSEATLWTRVLAAVVVLVVLAGVAAVAMVFAMMIVLFSVDGRSAGSIDEAMFQRIAWVVSGSLVIAVVLPPVLLLFRVSPAFSAIPAGVGFVSAGVATLWFAMANLGGN